MNQEILDQINAIIPKENILGDEPMSRHTTFRTGGPADYFIRISSKNRRQQLGQAVHGQQHESGRDKVLEKGIRTGHLGAKQVEHRRSAPAFARRIEPHHHGAADGAEGDEEGQYFEQCFHNPEQI